MYGWENVIVTIIAAAAIQTRLVMLIKMNSIDRTAPMPLEEKLKAEIANEYLEKTSPAVSQTRDDKRGRVPARNHRRCGL